MGCGVSRRENVEPPSKIPPNTLGAHYHVEHLLGRGQFSTVRAGLQRVTGDLVAIKTLKRSNANFDVAAIRIEIECMKRIKHPNCIQLFETFKGSDAIHLVQERGEGGDLWERVQAHGPIPEHISLWVMRQLMEAVAFLHQNGVCHRDLKPENIIMMARRPKDPAFWTAKITDYGFSRNNVTGYFKCMETTHGTPEFVAPEILLKMLPERVAHLSGFEQPAKYSAKCDVYSAGVILYTLIAGKIPFSFQENLPMMIQCIMQQQLDFSGETWGRASEDVKAFIRVLMAVDPAKRPNAGAAAALPLMTGASPPASGRGGKVPPGIKSDHDTNGVLDGSLSEATTRKAGEEPAETSYIADLDGSDAIPGPDLIRSKLSDASVDSSKQADLERHVSGADSLDSLTRAEVLELEHL